MISYRDMAFCSAKCKNKACDRNQKHIPADVELPIAFSDFSPTCKIYQPEDGK